MFPRMISLQLYFVGAVDVYGPIKNEGKSDYYEIKAKHILLL